MVNTPVCCRRISIPKLIRIFCCCFCLKANPGGELPDKVEIRVLHSSKHIKTQPSRTQVIHRLETSEKENLERLEERTYTGEYEETYCGEIMYGKTTSSKQQDCTGNLDEDIPNFFMNCYSPDKWLFSINQREDKNCGYYFSTAILKQYTQTAKERNFYGCLPSIIIGNRIENKSTNRLIKVFTRGKITEDQFYQQFLSNTEVGKCHQRRSNLFGLRTIGLTLEKTSPACRQFNRIIFHVEPDPAVYGSR
ncbi:hypothetical protein [Endozoicomonas atrinae]|uniref:hypothetical protein n=1 Tax=Endozoicomonas atrinae TaxID=1333660 RepID=UPI000AFF02E9|nr:hypothetical protein [Endozoicomonas atrinae]